MYITGKIRIKAVIPDVLSKLEDLAYNLWWTWNPEAAALFKEIDGGLWERLGGNPVRFLQEVSQQNLIRKANDESFVENYRIVAERFDRYMSGDDTWFKKNHPSGVNNYIAYFSAEFGLHEVLPVYSGGLGVLSGDHCKSASDLGVPMIAVGLFYMQGYFNQRINHEGWQETYYTNLNPSQLPLRPVYSADGNRLVIDVDLPGRKLYAQVWRVSVGRVNVFLLDSDIDLNSPMDRSLTSRLYGGDQETRIQQEILLGIGGARALEAMGFKPAVYHMNEGHSAFLGLELLRKLIQEKGLSFSEAKEVAASCLVFTTHTPVPAGNDVFPAHMIDKYFDAFRDTIGVDRDTFLRLGAKGTEHIDFNMTVLALNLAGMRNGVSELHGAVTRNIFRDVWNNVPEVEVPVSHITNGIHTLSWVSDSFRELYDSYLGKDWILRISDEENWKRVDNIPDSVLWDKHCQLKRRMIDYIREKVREQKKNNREPVENLDEAESWLDPEALTIGFARRFATYKRANLIFRDMEKIRALLNNPQMPVQIIFAGKAHPADRPAHEIIKNIHDISLQEGFKGRVILLENYNKALARHMVAGVDLWLNNPRRPLEASGTSGQKVCVNGIINFSVLDGWWCEGYNEHNGWTIGDDTFYSNDFSHDIADSRSIYDTLENQIIPLFYKRDESGIPTGWVKLMKESIKSTAWRFSTDRMVQEYMEKMYYPLMERMDKIMSSEYQFARELAGWKSFIHSKWREVRIHAATALDKLESHESVSGKPVRLSVEVSLGEISPEDVSVEVYYGVAGQDEILEEPMIQQMKCIGRTSESTYRYETDITLIDGGDYSYTFRVVPYNEKLINRFDMGLIRWIGADGI